MIGLGLEWKIDKMAEGGYIDHWSASARPAG